MIHPTFRVIRQSLSAYCYSSRCRMTPKCACVVIESDWGVSQVFWESLYINIRLWENIL